MAAGAVPSYRHEQHRERSPRRYQRPERDFALIAVTGVVWC